MLVLVWWWSLCLVHFLSNGYSYIIQTASSTQDSCLSSGCFPLLHSLIISWPLAWTYSQQFNFILDTKHLGLTSALAGCWSCHFYMDIQFIFNLDTIPRSLCCTHGNHVRYWNHLPPRHYSNLLQDLFYYTTPQKANSESTRTRGTRQTKQRDEKFGNDRENCCRCFIRLICVVGLLFSSLYPLILAVRVITGLNIVTLYRHILMFFNLLLNPVINGWRMRQIRHAIVDTPRKIYTNREL